MRMIMSNEDFELEVYWKNERTARVWSEGPNVYVEAFTDSPVKRLFPNKTWTRK